MIGLEVECSSELGADPAIEGVNSQRLTEPVQKVVQGERSSHRGEKIEAEDSESLHESLVMVPTVCRARRKRTSNSVQSFSDDTRRKSPPCKRASSRARFKPRPWPVISSPTEPRWKRSKMCSRAGAGMDRPVLPIVTIAPCSSSREDMRIRTAG